MKRQQKQEKENLQEMQDRKHEKKSQMAKMSKSSPRQEEVKKADRTHKKSRARTLNFDANNEVPRFCSKVSVFKELINSGPYYMCCY